MQSVLRAGVVTAALTISTLAVAAPAGAVTDFRNCDHMHRTFKYGVAKSERAANRQWRSGSYRPAVRPLVYRVNDESDADDDGTACEVSR
jgi:hypothetical protein